MRRLFGRGTPRVDLQPTPYLRRHAGGDTWTPPVAGPSTSPSTPISASQTWAPVNTVSNQDDWYELVNKIRFLASMGSEDRPLILEVCDRASTAANAREAIKALMHEFKHGCADAQLSAARLWAILLRNSSTEFIMQSTAVDFLETLEALIVSNATSPVVRNRVLHVLGDAVYSNPNAEAFHRLWMIVKSQDAPDQGSPYNAHDAILRPHGHRRLLDVPTILERIAPLIPQPRGPDNRFPYEWEAPPPSYETATNIVVPRRVSYAASVDEIVSDISAHHGSVEEPESHSHFDDGDTGEVQPSASPAAPNSTSERPAIFTPSQGLSPPRPHHMRDSPPSTNETVPTVRPTAIRRAPFTQRSVTMQNRTDRSKKQIYGCMLSYLRGVASAHDESRTLTRLECFGAEMAKLGAVDCLVHALQYKATLVETSSDLGVADYPRLKAALEADEAALGDKVLEVLYCPSDEQAVLALEDNAAQSLLDIIQYTLDNALLPTRDATSKARRLIGKLAKACDKLPTSLIISGVTQRDEHASFCGGFGDVFKAMYQGKPVALKHMRMFQATDQRDIRRRFCREALLWQRLRHPYIVPLIGIDTESFPSSLSLVSPWMKHGTVVKYLSGFSDSARQKMVERLIREIAQGLAFLHDQRVVHGDLRGSNILVDDSGSACLTDFGLTVLSDATVTHTNHGAGSVRWMAPETLNPAACGLTDFARTFASDIYAFACLYTGFPPFHEAVLYDAPVMLQVIDGVRPARPAGNLVPDYMWNIMQQCWAHDFAERPTILGIVLELVMHERLSAAAGDPDVTITVDVDEGSDPDQVYEGWVVSAIGPLAEFMDMSVNPRNHYVDLQDIADSPGGATLYVARLAPTDHDLLALPDDVRERDEHDLREERPTFVAIKSVPIMPTGSSKMEEVARERRILADIQCENLLQMDALYVDLAEDALWIRMELMTRTLSSIIELNRAGLMLSDRMIAGCAKDILNALEHLEKNNIAPRNIRSNNVLVSPQGILKLTNLSNAMKLSEGPSVSRSTNIRSDASALGALVWEMAAGRRPSLQDQPAGSQWPPLSAIASRTPAFHEFVKMCFDPAVTQFGYRRLIESSFIRQACERTTLAQLLVQCTAFEGRFRERRRQ
ncbi:kinase-like domain-containing protein [Mycena sanguinolenta]|nr:kinase-like domain-containing protein [Mycena sanguinolenta]